MHRDWCIYLDQAQSAFGSMRLKRVSGQRRAGCLLLRIKGTFLTYTRMFAKSYLWTAPGHQGPAYSQGTVRVMPTEGKYFLQSTLLVLRVNASRAV